MKMAAINARPGNVLDHEGKLWVVSKYEIIQPGKGASVIQIEMRDIRTGNKTNVRFRTQEMIERIRLDEAEYQYLYEDPDGFNFMNQTNYEQIVVGRDFFEDKAAYLQENMIVVIETYEGEPLSYRLPDSVILEVVEAEPVVKGQTASSSYKPAIMNNGVKVMVPPHIDLGSKIVVKTEDNSYVEKAK
jgi:elongation factor P